MDNKVSIAESHAYGVHKRILDARFETKTKIRSRHAYIKLTITFEIETKTLVIF